MVEQAFENPYGFTPDDFAPDGVLALSPEAQAEGRDFVSHLQQFEPSSRWIAGFAWCYDRSMRENPGSEMIDEGPGIDLAGYRATEIPAGPVEVRDGVPFTFVIPRDKVDFAKRKEIVQVRLASGRLSFALE